ncbi:MAG: DUF6607 family protein [Pseudomonadota bacterium]
MMFGLRRLGIACLIALAGCATTPADGPSGSAFEQDREAILAMAGDFAVSFDFTETVAFADGYELKEPYLSGGVEIVRVIEDSGEFISLQHILVVGDEEKFPVKHWRQDWAYEPSSLLVFVGGNAWRTRDLGSADSRGKWSQTVYQVDDAPRYGALAAWRHDSGVSQWKPPSEWRPLPRRDATTRDDYHAVDAVNRHAITPSGWVHEQDNAKLALAPDAQVIVREIGVNDYRRLEGADVSVAEEYWAATADYWSGVRQEWSRMETDNAAFGLTIQGEPEALYIPILELAEAVNDGSKTVDQAIDDAKAVIAEFTTTEIGALEDRLR